MRCTHTFCSLHMPASLKMGRPVLASITAHLELMIEAVRA
jgi:hypothetical protein